MNGRQQSAGATSPAFAFSAHAHAQIEIAAPPERIWALLTEIERWPRWNAFVQAASLRGSLEAGSVFRWTSKGFSVTSTLREVIPNRRISWTGEAFGTKALHSWELDTTDHGVTLRTAEWFGGWLPKLMPRTMQRTLDETLPAWLEAIRKEAERSVWLPDPIAARPATDSGQ